MGAVEELAWLFDKLVLRSIAPVCSGLTICSLVDIISTCVVRFFTTIFNLLISDNYLNWTQQTHSISSGHCTKLQRWQFCTWAMHLTGAFALTKTASSLIWVVDWYVITLLQIPHIYLYLISFDISDISSFLGLHPWVNWTGFLWKRSLLLSFAGCRHHITQYEMSCQVFKIMFTNQGKQYKRQGQVSK